MAEVANPAADATVDGHVNGIAGVENPGAATDDAAKSTPFLHCSQACFAAICCISDAPAGSVSNNAHKVSQFAV